MMMNATLVSYNSYNVLSQMGRCNRAVDGTDPPLASLEPEAAVNEQYCRRWGHVFLPCVLQKEEMVTWFVKS